MIEVAPGISIDEADLQFEFVQSGGPGGQNVNKVATAVQLRYSIERANLPPDAEERLGRLAGKRLTTDGTLIIHARRYRQQEKNRQDAIDRLVKLLADAATPQKPRRATKPGVTARVRRMEKKRRRSQTKQLRRNINNFDDPQ